MVAPAAVLRVGPEVGAELRARACGTQGLSGRAHARLSDARATGAGAVAGAAVVRVVRSEAHSRGPIRSGSGAAELVGGAGDVAAAPARPRLRAEGGGGRRD